MVFACAWSPCGSLLASGSGDSTARIWTIADGSCRSSIQNEPANVDVAKHFKGRATEKSKDVTTLDWNDDGTLLATGSYDGQARIWGRDGELRATLIRQRGPIFSLKWNKEDDNLLTGSVDKTAFVWDVKSGEWKQQFEFHTGKNGKVVNMRVMRTSDKLHSFKPWKWEQITSNLNLRS